MKTKVKIDLSEYDLVAPTNIECNNVPTKMYDLVVKDDHTFYYECNGEFEDSGK